MVSNLYIHSPVAMVTGYGAVLMGCELLLFLIGRLVWGNSFHWNPTNVVGNIES